MSIFFKSILIISTILLIGCGGGGSSSDKGLEYKGKTTKAILNENTFKDFVSQLPITPIDITDISEDEDENQKIFKKYFKLEKSTSETIKGRKSGTVDVSREEISSLKIKMIATFKNYNDGTETLNGKVIYLITVDEEESFFIREMDISFKNFEIKNSSDDITMNGSTKMTSNKEATRKTFVQNILLKDNKNENMIKFENFIMIVDGEDNELSYVGKIYDSRYGYVEVSTPIELSYDTDGKLLHGGVIIYKGKDSTIKEKIAYENSIRVELHNEKTGEVDKVEVYNIETMEVVPNRKPIINILFPKKIYTDTNMNKTNISVYDPDLDAFSTEYEWKVDNKTKSTVVNIDNNLFKKHQYLQLTVTATDDRVGKNEVGIKSLKQEVLNSKPIAKITTNIVGDKIESLSSIQFDTSLTTDKDHDKLNYKWEVYKYIHNDEAIYSEGEYIEEDTALFNDFSLFRMDANKYLNNIKSSKPIYKAISEGKHIIKCIVWDDDKAMDTTQLTINTEPLDILMNSTSKVLFPNQDSLYEFTFNSTIKAFDLDHDGEEELIYFTRNPDNEEGDSLLHISSHIKSSKSETKSFSVGVLTSSNIEFVDFNGNGRTDIILLGENNRYVMLQKEDSSFEEALEIELNRGVLYIDDMNEDNKTDSVKLDDCNLNIFTDFMDKNKTIIYKIKSCQEIEETHTLAVSDMNNDGIDDFIVFTYNSIIEEGMLLIVYKNLKGDFNETQTIFLKEKVFSESISIGDINGDGFNDVVIDFLLFENMKNFQLKEIKTLETYENASTRDGLVILDMNNDKREDIFYENAGSLRILIQNENFQMNDFKIKDVILNRVISDIDNDGKIEIIENYHNRIEITSLK